MNEKILIPIMSFSIGSVLSVFITRHLMLLKFKKIQDDARKKSEITDMFFDEFKVDDANLNFGFDAGVAGLTEEEYCKLIDDTNEVVSDKTFSDELKKVIDELNYNANITASETGMSLTEALGDSVAVLKRPIPDKKDEIDISSPNLFQEYQEQMEKEGETRDSNSPYVIDADEYYAYDEEYEKLILMYYKGDKVFTDESDQLVPDAQRFVGDIEFVNFEDSTDGHKLAYIRNEKEKKDFEILQFDRGFAETLNGQAGNSAEK